MISLEWIAVAVFGTFAVAVFVAADRSARKEKRERHLRPVASIDNVYRLKSARKTGTR